MLTMETPNFDKTKYWKDRERNKSVPRRFRTLAPGFDLPQPPLKRYSPIEWQVKKQKERMDVNSLLSKKLARRHRRKNPLFAKKT